MRLSISALLTLLATCIAGCGHSEPWGEVSGAILLDAQPVFPAVVLFSDRERGVEATAETDARGQFTLRTAKLAGLPVGNYVVTVVPLRKDVAPQQGMVFDQPAPMPETDFPAEVQDMATTRLSASVKEGKNRFSFELAQFR